MWLLFYEILFILVIVVVALWLRSFISVPRYIELIVGNKGASKTLYLASSCVGLFKSYRKTEKKYPKLRKRILMSKEPFGVMVEGAELAVNLSGVPLPKSGHLYYWSNAEQLHYCPRWDCWFGQKQHLLHNADIIWTEIGNDLPPESWESTPVWLRQLFSECRHRGVRIYADTQRYDMVNVHFKRQCDRVIEAHKLIGSRDLDVTKPDPKWVYVLAYYWHMKAVDVANEDDERNLEYHRMGVFGLSIPEVHFYTKNSVAIYDSYSKSIQPYKPNKMSEIVLECELGDDCTDKAHRRRVIHRAI